MCLSLFKYLHLFVSPTDGFPRREHEFFYSNNKDKSRPKFQILLTTYEMLLTDDAGEIATFPWKVRLLSFPGMERGGGGGNV